MQAAEANFPRNMGCSAFLVLRDTSGAAGVVEEAVVLAMGDPAVAVQGESAPLLRIHSQCLTGDAFHSLRCDCRANWRSLCGEISAEGRGIIIYELQEGRGIGLMNKLRAYELQDRGADTVEANEQLGFDGRSAELSAAGGHSAASRDWAVRLLSNNPGKVKALEDAGIIVTERVPCIAAAMESTEAYLRTKREKMGHFRLA